jgi:hypothetical protein
MQSSPAPRQQVKSAEASHANKSIPPATKLRVMRGAKYISDAQLFLSQVRLRFCAHPEKLRQIDRLLINGCNFTAVAYHQGNPQFHDLLEGVRQQARELFDGHLDLTEAFETNFVARDESEWTVRNVITSIIQEVEDKQNLTGSKSAQEVSCADASYTRKAGEVAGSQTTVPTTIIT